MKLEIEKFLNRLLIIGRNERTLDAGIKISEVKIADIVFAFDNAELIQLLRTRGGHIMYQRFDKMREVEAEIT